MKLYRAVTSFSIFSVSRRYACARASIHRFNRPDTPGILVTCHYYVYKFHVAHFSEQHFPQMRRLKLISASCSSTARLLSSASSYSATQIGAISSSSRLKLRPSRGIWGHTRRSLDTLDRAMRQSIHKTPGKILNHSEATRVLTVPIQGCSNLNLKLALLNVSKY